jgi:UDP-glucose 4-epimerase
LSVLVFGATGFVGRNLVERLVLEGYDVIGSDVTDNPYAGTVDYLKGDILDRNHVFEAAKKSDIIVHLAASSLVESLKDPLRNMRVNVEGTLNILDAARKYDVHKVIYSSASSVVGSVERSPVDESQGCTPRTPYAVAKKACEDYLRVYHEAYGLRYLVFRLFNVYGPWQAYQSGALVPSLHRTLMEDKEFQVYGDGSNTRDFIYVRDVVEYCCSAIKNQTENLIVNMGTGQGTSIIQLIELASQLLGMNPKITHKPSRPGEIGNFVADTRRLVELFGARPFTSLREGLKKSFAWLEASRKPQNGRL